MNLVNFLFLFLILTSKITFFKFCNFVFHILAIYHPQKKKEKKRADHNVLVRKDIVSTCASTRWFPLAFLLPNVLGCKDVVSKPPQVLEGCH
jgi:hypothetical protein